MPLLVLLTFSSSEARYALTHTLEQLFPPQVCTDGCRPQTTTPKATFAEQSAVVQSSSSLTNKLADISTRVQTVRLEVKLNSLKLARSIDQNAFPRAPPRVAWFR